jgi:hypothetical protein
VNENSPIPPDDLEIDLVMLQRVRAALREVPEQDAQVAQQARERALTELSPRRRRSSMWLTGAAAAVIGLVIVATALRSADDDLDDTVASAPAVTEPEPAGFRMAEAPQSAEAPEAADLAKTMAESVVDATLDSIRTLVAAGAVLDSVCPTDETEQSFGQQWWNGQTVEVLADRSSGIIRLVDLTTCDEIDRLTTTG